MAAASLVQLEQLSGSGEGESPQQREQEPEQSQTLPPTDHGRAAYLVLAGCAIMQAPVWGEAEEPSSLLAAILCSLFSLQDIP